MRVYDGEEWVDTLRIYGFNSLFEMQTFVFKVPVEREFKFQFSV